MEDEFPSQDFWRNGQIIVSESHEYYSHISHIITSCPLIVFYLVEYEIQERTPNMRWFSAASKTLITVAPNDGSKKGGKRMSTIVHFEIPADDVKRAKKFYTGLFGWEITEQPMDYWLIATGGEDAVGGGMMKRQRPEQQIMNYMGVPSVDEYAAKVEKLGGKVVAPKMPVPGMGYFAVCLDTENNIFALWEDDENAK